MSDEKPKWPYRIPETEQEIKAAIGWLKETGQIPQNVKIKNAPGPTPLDRLGLPMEEVKDLMALRGAGSFGRQVGVQMRREAAGCVTALVHLALAGVGIVALLLFVGAIGAFSHSGNPAYYQASVVPAPTPEVTATSTPDYAPRAELVVPRAELVRLPRNR
jgi:hypothetical protein